MVLLMFFFYNSVSLFYIQLILGNRVPTFYERVPSVLLWLLYCICLFFPLVLAGWGERALCGSHCISF